jgi:CBS domain containing-hemolysin-like protein
MIIAFPIGYPISKALDWIVGHEETHLSRNILISILKQQKEVLSPEEIKMSTGAINLMKRRVDTLLIRKIFYLNENTILTEHIIQKIKRKGYSRIPIYDDKKQCVKILITKSMIFYGDFLNKKLIDCPFKFINPVAISMQNNAYQALARMKKFKTSILMVVDKHVMASNQNEPEVRLCLVGVINR